MSSRIRNTLLLDISLRERQLKEGSAHWTELLPAMRDMLGYDPVVESIKFEIDNSHEDIELTTDNQGPVVLFLSSGVVVDSEPLALPRGAKINAEEIYLAFNGAYLTKINITFIEIIKDDLNDRDERS